MSNEDHTVIDNPLAGAWLLYRLIFGPLAWPVVLANVAGLAWCIWKAALSFPV